MFAYSYIHTLCFNVKMWHSKTLSLTVCGWLPYGYLSCRPVSLASMLCTLKQALSLLIICWNHVNVYFQTFLFLISRAPCSKSDYLNYFGYFTWEISVFVFYHLSGFKWTRLCCPAFMCTNQNLTKSEFDHSCSVLCLVALVTALSLDSQFL